MVSECDLAWLAGFIDADGCLYINKRIVGNKIKYQAKIQVVGVREDMILKCQRIGQGGHVRKRNPRRQNWKPIFVWEAGPRTIRELLPALIPYLCKKEQALKLIRAMEIVKNRGRIIGGDYGCPPMTQKEQKEVEVLFLETKSLHI